MPTLPKPTGVRTSRTGGVGRCCASQFRKCAGCRLSAVGCRMHEQSPHAESTANRSLRHCSRNTYAIGQIIVGWPTHRFARLPEAFRRRPILPNWRVEGARTKSCYAATPVFAPRVHGGRRVSVVARPRAARHDDSLGLWLEGDPRHFGASVIAMARLPGSADVASGPASLNARAGH